MSGHPLRSWNHQGSSEIEAVLKSVSAALPDLDLFHQGEGHVLIFRLRWLLRKARPG